MDGIANIAKQQQTQIAAHEIQGRNVEQSHQSKLQQNDLVKQAQESNVESDKKINSKDDMKKLIDSLNNALSPLNTDIKFGVDSQDIFYVSVIEKKTNKMIRRFPAEQAQQILPKIQEVNGVLFDHKG